MIHSDDFNDLQWLILVWSLVMGWNHQPSNPVFSASPIVPAKGSAESSAFCSASSRLEEAVVHGIWRWHRVANIFDLRWSKPEPNGLASILENPWNGVYGVLMGLGFRLILDFKPSLIWTCNQSIQIQSKIQPELKGETMVGVTDAPIFRGLKLQEPTIVGPSYTNHTYINIYIYIFIYLFTYLYNIYVCVCVLQYIKRYVWVFDWFHSNRHISKLIHVRTSPRDLWHLGPRVVDVLPPCPIALGKFGRPAALVWPNIGSKETQKNRGWWLSRSGP